MKPQKPLKDFLPYIFDTICVYEEDGDEYKNLYKGNKENVPSALLERNVRIIGAASKQVIDIEVY